MIATFIAEEEQEEDESAETRVLVIDGVQRLAPQAAIDAFEKARRNEELEEFAEKISHQLRVESGNANHESEMNLDGGSEP